MIDHVAASCVSVLKKILTPIIGEERTAVMLSYVMKCMSGEEELWKIFWIFSFLFPLVYSLFVLWPLSATGRLGYSVGLLIFLPYMVWALKSVWTCSANIEADEVWGIEKEYIAIAAKVFVVLASLNLFLQLFG